MMKVHLVLERIINKENLSSEEAACLMQYFADGLASPSQVGALLTALRYKGETSAEITGFAKEMRNRLTPAPAKSRPLLDTCGTGGSRFKVFNVSTAAAFVAASAGIHVAKHGNRAASGVCGSADVLEALGANIHLTPQQCGESIDTVGVGFLFAPSHHPSLKSIGAVRRELGIRTIFNILGPLANPAGAEMQVVGVYDSSLCRTMAEALQLLGCSTAFVVHGRIGMGEISTIGITDVCKLQNGVIESFELDRGSLGLNWHEPDPSFLLPAQTPTENASLLLEVLDPEAENELVRIQRELVAVNAAAALIAGAKAENWQEAVQYAQSLISSGSPLNILKEFISFTNHYSSL